MDNILISITNLLTTTTLSFFSPPESISDGVAANFAAQNIRGRSSQYHGYEDTGPRTTSISTVIHEDYLFGVSNIVDFTNKLRAFAYPAYTGFVVPPRCYVKIGNNLGGLCIANQVDVNWQLPIRNNRYIRADVTISLTVLEPMAPSVFQVEAGGGGNLPNLPHSQDSVETKEEIIARQSTEQQLAPATADNEWWRLDFEKAGGI